MINALIVTCMLAMNPATVSQQKDTTTVVIKFPPIKKPVRTDGKK